MFLILRQKIAEKLRGSGYRVISPFRVPLGWVDIGIFGRANCGVDIFSGCYTSCAERLSSHPFSRTFILGSCSVCDSLETLGEYLGVQFGLEEILCTDGSVSRVDEVDEVSMHTRAIEDALAFMYIVREVYEDKVEEYRFRPLEIAIPDLKRFGFVVSYSRPKISPKYFLTLTKDGMEISRKILTRRILVHEKKLRKMAENPLTYLIALGISANLGISNTGFEVEDWTFKSILEKMRNVPLESFNYINNPRIQRSFMLNPKLIISHFLVNTALNSMSIKLSRALSNMGLAYRVKIYTPFGDKVGEEYRIAREAIETLLKFSHADIDHELLIEFMSVSYPLFSNDIHFIVRLCRDYLKKAEQAGVCRLIGNRIKINENFEKYAKIRLSKIVERILHNF